MFGVVLLGCGSAPVAGPSPIAETHCTLSEYGTLDGEGRQIVLRECAVPGVENPSQNLRVSLRWTAAQPDRVRLDVAFSALRRPTSIKAFAVLADGSPYAFEYLADGTSVAVARELYSPAGAAPGSFGGSLELLRQLVTHDELVLQVASDTSGVEHADPNRVPPYAETSFVTALEGMLEAVDQARRRGA
ncbi:MAG: hypothetical protein V2I63_11170 [Pseudomonadales bacterium]|nr:hypothetical protein [Pseudomonadales bacterium]